MTHRYKPTLVKDFSKLKRRSLVCYGNPDNLDKMSMFRYCIVDMVEKIGDYYQVWGYWKDDVTEASKSGVHKTYFQKRSTERKRFSKYELYILDKEIDKEYDNLWV